MFRGSVPAPGPKTLIFFIMPFFFLQGILSLLTRYAPKFLRYSPATVMQCAPPYIFSSYEHLQQFLQSTRKGSYL